MAYTRTIWKRADWASKRDAHHVKSGACSGVNMGKTLDQFEAACAKGVIASQQAFVALQAALKKYLAAMTTLANKNPNEPKYKAWANEIQTQLIDQGIKNHARAIEEYGKAHYQAGQMTGTLKRQAEHFKSGNHDKKTIADAMSKLCADVRVFQFYSADPHWDKCEARARHLMNSSSAAPPNPQMIHDIVELIGWVEPHINAGS
jgi:hypothetical protein